MSIQATDPYGTIVTISYNTNDAIQNAYNSVRNAFIDAYSAMIYACEWSGTGNTRTCIAIDTRVPPNTTTHTADITQPTESIRRETIGHFVDLYGMSDDNALYQLLIQY